MNIQWGLLRTVIVGLSLLIGYGYGVSAAPKVSKKTQTVKKTQSAKKVQAVKKTQKVKQAGKKNSRAGARPMKVNHSLKPSSKPSIPSGVAPGMRDEAQQNLRQVRKQIDALALELEKNKKEYHSASEELQKSQEAIEESNRSLTKLHSKYKSSQQSLLSLKDDLKQTKKSIKLSQAALSNVVRKKYIKSHQSLIASQQALTPWDRVSRNQHDSYLSYMVRAQQNRIVALKKESEKKAQLVKVSEGTVESLAQDRAKEQEEQKQLKAELEDNKQIVTTLSKQLETQQARLKTLKQNETQLSNVVKIITKRIAAQEKERKRKLALARKENAAKQEAARRQAEMAAAKDASGKEGASVALNVDVATQPEPIITGEDEAYGQVPFSHLRGRLRSPVVGHLMNRFGAERSDTGSKWKGIFIQAPAGAMIRTLAPGRVVYADKMRGYGNIIIVDHGQGYMSIYGHNDTLLRRAGDAVKSGDALATVGNTGGVENYGLYLELRHQDRPIDPLQWMQAG